MRPIKEATGARISRRGFVLAGGAVAAAAALRVSYGQSAQETGQDYKQSTPVTSETRTLEVRIIEFSDKGEKGETKMVPLIVKTEQEWKKELPPDVFEVTRHGREEKPKTGPIWNLTEKGIYRCACCGNALFSSEDKFDSPSGLASFKKPIARGNIRETADLKRDLIRTAILCRKCDGRVGHEYSDGPDPIGLRYSVYSPAIKFIKHVD